MADYPKDGRNQLICRFAVVYSLHRDCDRFARCYHALGKDPRDHGILLALLRKRSELHRSNHPDPRATEESKQAYRFGLLILKIQPVPPGQSRKKTEN